MDDLLRACDLYDKYHSIFTEQGLTIDRFEKLSKLNQTSFANTVMERCKMTCGDFIELICEFERHQHTQHSNATPIKRQNEDLNSKKAQF